MTIVANWLGSANNRHALPVKRGSTCNKSLPANGVHLVNLHSRKLVQNLLGLGFFGAADDKVPGRHVKRRDAVNVLRVAQNLTARTECGKPVIAEPVAALLPRAVL